MEGSSEIHPRRLKSFVRHLCVVAKKHKDREEARAELQKQVSGLKRFSSKKKEMDQDHETNVIADVTSFPYLSY